MTRIQEDLIRINIAAAMRQAADMGLQGVSEEKMALLMQVFNVEVHDNGTGISLEGIVPVYEDITTDADTRELVSIVRRLPAAFRAEFLGEARGFMRCMEMMQ